MTRSALYSDPPSPVLGQEGIKNGYIPLYDPALPVHQVIEAFYVWVSSYYHHGETKETLDIKRHVEDPASTYARLTTEERASVLEPVPADPRGGSDMAVLTAGIVSGAFAVLREQALCLPSSEEGPRAWDAVDIRYVWCDSGPWVMPWAAMSLQKEVSEKEKEGIKLRNVTFTRLRGANHFVRHAILASRWAISCSTR